MLGNCPVCKKKIKKEELKNLKNFESARCFGCGKLFVNNPWYVVTLFLVMILFPFVISYTQNIFQLIICWSFEFIIVALYNEIKICLPLIEDR